MDTHYTFKSIIVGESSTGKSSLIRSFLQKPFNLLHDLTIGVEFEQNIMTVLDENNDPKHIKLNIWDTAGLERFQAITHVYFKCCCIVFLVYDVTNATSFKKVPEWLKIIQEKCVPHVTIVLIGNKCDTQIRQIHSNEGLTFANNHGILFMETSAKTGENVNIVFKMVCEEVLHNHVHSVENNRKNGIIKGNINTQLIIQSEPLWGTECCTIT
tara:strand:- start:121 stop:759 length:639 start_codon:yes stop_codon:yes gene_type:complete